MAAPQPGAVVNLILLIVCGAVGWFIAAWTKSPPAARAGTVELSSGPGNEPGVFATDARRLLARDSAGAVEFDDLITRYGAGSLELPLLAPLVIEKWAASDPVGAASAGLSRCLEYAPDVLPEAMASIAAGKNTAPAVLLAAVPSGPLRDPCLAALAAAWGRSARDEVLVLVTPRSRQERTLFLREWHRGRGGSDLPAAEKSAGACTDADDKAAAVTGCLLARAAAEPETTLRESAVRDDFPLIAATAFRHWLPGNEAAAWNFVASLKNDSRLPAIAAALLKSETGRRRAGDVLPEIQSQLNRIFPAGAPQEILETLIPALAAEQTAAAQKFIELLPRPRPGEPDQLRQSATALLFDTLCTSDPAAAWRLAESFVQREGATDNRSTHRWSSAMARESATPQERIDAGFPDFTDMTNLAIHWLESDTPAALTTFCRPGVQAPLQRLAVEAALSPHGAAIPLSELLEWAKHQPPHMLHTIEAVGAR